MSGLWNDFNDAQPELQPHPQGHARQGAAHHPPGGYDDPAQGWTGGYATRGTTGASISTASSPCSRARTPGARSSR